MGGSGGSRSRHPALFDPSIPHPAKKSKYSKLRHFRSFWGQINVCIVFYVKFCIRNDLSGALPIFFFENLTILKYGVAVKVLIPLSRKIFVLFP